MHQGREEVVVVSGLTNLLPSLTEQLIQNQLLERKTRRNYYCELVRTVIRMWSECSAENWFPFQLEGFARVSLSCPQIPGHISDDDMTIALDVEHDLQQRGALVVQKVVEPPPLHQLRKYHRNQAIWVDTLKIKDVLDNRTGDETIRRGQHHQLWRSEARFCSGMHYELAPFLHQGVVGLSISCVLGRDMEHEDVLRKRVRKL